MPFQFNTGEEKLSMFFKPWQVEALNYLDSIRPRGANSREVCFNVKKKKQISRASIINYLNAMVENDVLNFTDTTGKGGHHRVYASAHSETGLKKYIAEHIIRKLLEEFPEETRQVINQLR